MPNFSAGSVQKLRKSDGTDGLVSFGSAHVNISSSTDNYFFLSDLDTFERIDDVIFSSYWFNYLSVSTYSAQNGTVNLPSRTAVFSSGDKKSDPIPQPYFGVAEYLIINHGKNYVPAFAAFDTSNNRPMGGTQVINYGNSYRFISIASNNTSIYARETFGVGSTSLPSESLNFSFLIFDQGLETTPSYSEDPLLISQDRVVFGSGKFDTDFNYLYLNNNSNFRINEQGGLRNLIRNDQPWYCTLEVVRDGSLDYSITGSVPAFEPLRTTFFEYSAITGKTSGVSLP